MMLALDGLRRDLNGAYGGLNGVGGLEGTQSGFGFEPFQPALSDARGNVLGAVTNGINVSWTPARPTGYGTVPGYGLQPLTLGASLIAPGWGGDVVQSSAWRGKYPETTGYIYLGARYYNPESGSFLSTDPVWNGRDPNYYTAGGGDLINYFDADGRIGKRVLTAFLDDNPDALYEGTPLYHEYVREQVEVLTPMHQAQQTFYNSLNPTEQRFYNSWIPFAWNSAHMSGAMQRGNLEEIDKAAANLRGEGAITLLTLGTARLLAGSPVSIPVTAPRTFLPGEVMPNGQIAGMGPGAAFRGEFSAVEKPPVIGTVRPYNQAKANKVPGYDDHHLDPRLGRTDPTYNTGPTIPVRNDNAGGKVPKGVNYHTGKGGFQDALNQHIKELGFTRAQWNALPEQTRLIHLRRYYASLGIPFPK